ncbi:ribonuclease E/G [Rhodospirillum rubrum]|uniref:ribonuclease E/G n=1 Tax=Rhodospirillum rubrum TaxID=1085 RepID=UPI0019060B65|nr:ribonuclease E/G [Rhodospirillum rubrum]MBK1665954.1 ribonuclease E/G [Rhodospirillum rubrum]MBK1678071.1 ribonuclease E/G [Rhodospirillum rubrum]
MTKRMLIDANHPEETRVVVLDGTRLDEFDVETSTKKQLKGNIYLAKVVRVEPSLQAAFVEYGGNRHGFLAFNEIHPDYYQIPVADREKLIAEEALEAAADDDDEADSVETLGGDEAEDSAPAPRAKSRVSRSYKIQEVIKRRQIMLVQVVKEERGNKGAALTTYLSLAGRYCVFMPNTTRGGGVSRKITSATDRKRLKSIMGELVGPKGSAVILRTAGSERSRAEIRRDHDYLLRTWDSIRQTTLASRAPCLIHEEGSLIKRAIRDIYSRDIEEILVEGDAGYRTAKDFMKMLTPSHAKKVQPYKDEIMPLFHRYQVESQMDAMHSPIAQLRSGGYLVINQTEALVAIDVNSGRSTRERNIEETAYKTNLEAADEIARQLRLRDLSGLIVIDFIDMDDPRSNANVERRVKDALRNDRARIQLGRISHFGLLEMSRQRLRPSLMETSFQPCPHCHGSGSLRSVESTAIHILRIIEEEGVRRRSSEVTVTVPTAIALYILNNKRTVLAAIEARYDFQVFLLGDDTLIVPDYRMDRVKAERDGLEALPAAVAPTASIAALPAPEVLEDEDEDEGTVEDEAFAEENGQNGSDADGQGRKRRRRRRRRRKDQDGVEIEGSSVDDEEGAPEGTADSTEDEGADDDGETGDEAEDTGDELDLADGSLSDRDGQSRRRRRRRGRRGRRDDTGNGLPEPAVPASTADTLPLDDDSTESAESDDDPTAENEIVSPTDADSAPAGEDPSAAISDELGREGRRPPRRRRPRRKDRGAETNRGIALDASDAEAGPATAETDLAAFDDAPDAEAPFAQPLGDERLLDETPAEIAEAAEAEVAETDIDRDPADREPPIAPVAPTPVAVVKTPDPAPAAAEPAAVPPSDQPRRVGWWSKLMSS